MSKTSLTEINNNIYIELDSLIDSRLATFYNIDKELTKEFLESGRYHSRIKDELSYISNHLFYKIYEQRDRDILKEVAPTKIVDLLKEYIIEAKRVNVEYNNSETTIYVNVYPYRLLEAELEWLTKAFLGMTFSSFNIEIINKDITEVTPKWIHENVGVMVMYRGIRWIEYHMDNRNLLDRPIPDVGMITPAIIDGKYKKEKTDLWENITMLLSRWIRINFIPVEEFSLKYKRK